MSRDGLAQRLPSLWYRQRLAPALWLLLPLAWLWLCFGAFRLSAAGFAAGEAELRAQRALLGPASAAERRTGHLPQIREFGTGETFVIDGLQIHPFAVSHDTSDPVGFIVSDGSVRLGYCTDTGRITQLIRHHLRQCQALILEANHDVQMLRDGPYPLALQQRVLSSRGHLANTDAIACADALAGERLQLLVLAHLSEVNNHPDMVLETARRGLVSHGQLRVMLADQWHPGLVLEVPQSPQGGEGQLAGGSGTNSLEERCG